MIQSDAVGGQLGDSVAAAGDVNGDGFSDVVVGSIYFDSGQTDEGAAFIFHGNDNRTGRPVVSRQLRAGAAIQPWGFGDLNSFEVEMNVAHPGGRGLVRLEVEACPPGVGFFDSGCVREFSSWVDTGSVSSVSALVGGSNALPEDTLYRWRGRLHHASLHVPSPENPPHGPWRRVMAQASEADIRTDSDFDGDGIGNAIDSDDDGDGLLDIVETGTNAFVSPSDTGTNPRNADSGGDTFPDGWEVTAGYDPTANLDPPFSAFVENTAIQVSDQPKYRNLSVPSEVFAAESVSPPPVPSLPAGPGTCSITVLSESECVAEFAQQGCLDINYTVVAPPNPPTSGFECCGWESECDLTCLDNTCLGGEACPGPCPVGVPASLMDPAYCVGTNLDCRTNEEGCDAERIRLKTRASAPDCCFLARGVEVFQWPPPDEPPVNSDQNVYPDQCDLCPNVIDNDQFDGDGDGRGDACDQWSGSPYVCADTDADGCDDCSSSFFDPANDGGPSDPPGVACPEPGGHLLIMSGVLGLAVLSRRRVQLLIPCS